MVKSVNGTTIKNLAQLVEVLRDCQDEFVTFEFCGRDGEALVFPRAAVLSATEDILNGQRGPQPGFAGHRWRCRKPPARRRIREVFCLKPTRRIVADTPRGFPASVGGVDAITREAILTLTKTGSRPGGRAVEVHRAMLKEAMHGQATATGTSFNAAAFDTQMTEAVLEQREKIAMGVEEAPSRHRRCL